MVRIISAIFAGAVVYYIWGMAAWMVLPLHTASIHKLPEEQAVIDMLRANNLETGVYVAPYATDPAEMSDPDSVFMKNHTAGPIFSVYYRADGTMPMGPGVLIGGFIVDLLAAAVAVCLLLSMGACSKSYACRVGFVVGLGVFVAVVGDLRYWNWMYFPLDYTIAFMVDVIVGWTLAGLVIAALVKPTSSVLGTGSSATVVPTQIEQTPAAPVEKKAAIKQDASPVDKTPTRNDAITLLATLQREARFVDIVKEPLGDYSDAQVGAAARDVLRDCGAVLDRIFEIEPILSQTEGERVEVPEGMQAAEVRITGANAQGAKSGALVHHGWRAKQCELPKWTGDKSVVMVVAPAELEAN